MTKPALPVPERSELMALLLKHGSYGAVSRHYGVGRTTAQHWGAIRQIEAADYRTGHANHKKLTKEDIPMIRELHGSGMTTAEIARKFEVVWVTIDNVISNKTWSWVK